MGDDGLEQKYEWSFGDLEDCLGTYNSWCKRVKKVIYAGDWGLLSFEGLIGFVGARKVSDYGRRVVEYFVDGLGDAGLAIVTGDLNGVEREVLRRCEKKDIKTIVVTRVPAEKASKRYHWVLRDRGLVLSVFGLGMPRYLAVDQHRLIGALAKKAVCVEVALGSGSLRIAKEYMRKGLTVMVPPYPFDDRKGMGGHELVSYKKAALVSKVGDVLEMYPSISLDTKRDIKDIVVVQKYMEVLELVKSGVSEAGEIAQVLDAELGEVFVALQALMNNKKIVEVDGRYLPANLR